MLFSFINTISSSSSMVDLGFNLTKTLMLVDSGILGCWQLDALLDAVTVYSENLMSFKIEFRARKVNHLV